MSATTKIKRRLTTIPAIAIAAILLTATLPLWVVGGALFDCASRRWRCPTIRLLAFGLGWLWLELAGVSFAALLWVVGMSRNIPLHYRLQKWWAFNLMRVLRTTTGLSVSCENADVLATGPLILLARHASLADSLVSAWAILTSGGRPRYVLKKELLTDPSLDVIGNRLPNYFLDRGAADSAGELAAITKLASDLHDRDVAVIFPEGTRSNTAKRAKALAKIAERDQPRADKLADLHHLLPPRPAGTLALLAGAPDADIVVAWHVGFDGLDTFGGILRHLAQAPPPVMFVMRRIPRNTVPTDPDAAAAWLDDVWLDSDNAVHQTLTQSPYMKDAQ